jgi:type IV pilus assembly protein PilX
MVLLILVVVSLLGVGAAQIALMSERGARNDRDMQLAWQAAEAGLIDAEVDLWDPTSTRHCLFDGKSTLAVVNEGAFNATTITDACGTTGATQGLYGTVVSGKPAWLMVDFTSTSSSAPTTEYGKFTSRGFQAGGAGVQPAQKPRYIIEPILAQSGDMANSEQEVVYRVTVMGFGPRSDIQAVVQMLYRI